MASINYLYLYKSSLNLKNHWYDYGWRFYDPVLGRFVCSDPLADKFEWVSPYNYAENSPIANFDLWGLQAISFNEFGPIRERMTGHDELNFQDNVANRNNPADQEAIDAYQEVGLAGLAEIGGELLSMSKAVGKVANKVKSLFKSGDDVVKAADDVVEVATDAGKNSSKYEDITTRSSIENRKTDISKSEFGQNLEAK